MKVLETFKKISISLLTNSSDNQEKGIKMLLIFKRRLTNEAMTTFLPSLLLISMAYATTFFKPFYFEAAVTVNLTVMLVLTTLFISVINKLPPTSYIKWTEIWLIFAQLVPFAQVILLTMLEVFRNKSEQEVPQSEKPHFMSGDSKEKSKLTKENKLMECWTISVLDAEVSKQ